MSSTYTDLENTNFPDAVDDSSGRPLLTNLPATLANALSLYNDAFLAGDSAQCAKILTQYPDLESSMFNATKYNWMRDAILAMQRYYFSDVQEHFDTITAEMNQNFSELTEALIDTTIGIDDSAPSANNSYSSQKIEELFSDTYQYKGVLTSSNDLDNVKDNGIYIYLPSSVPTNAPYTAAVIEVIGSSNQIIQRATRYGADGESSMRRYSSETWGDWIPIMTASQVKNNLTTTDSGYVLDARQGAVLGGSLKNWSATLTVDGWSDSYPYTQTVTVSNMLSTYKPVWGVRNNTSTLATAKKIAKNASYLQRVVTNNGSITVTAMTKPTYQLVLDGKGV